jgi:methionine-rich copper-binding protein CopC
VGIQTGLQGRLYTQVTEGLKEGDRSCPSAASSSMRRPELKSAGMAAMPGMDHSQMPGMTVAANAPAAPAAGGAPSVFGTDPAPNASVKAPLAMIHVMFNGKIDPKASGFEVTTSDGKRVDVGEAMPMGDTMLMAMPKTPLPKGSYKVKWHAAGADAKTIQGEFAFTVQ